jgi:colanic acid/amylovoran biosynthesis protein
MNILIDGTSTYNKGAELMLYAVLQELERKVPDTNVWFPLHGLPEGVSYIQTSLNFKQRNIPSIAKVFMKLKGPDILRKIFHTPCAYTTNRYAMKGLDIVFDAGGFQFSDQWAASDNAVALWDNYLYKLKKQGTKVIYLPQAFGPFETKNGKRLAAIVSNYADCIIVREQISYNYLINAEVNENKVLLYPDFTPLVDGIFPTRFEGLRGGIALIPNMRMIDKGSMSINNYIDLFIQIVDKCKKVKPLFLLNHEGKSDFLLCQAINQKLTEKLPIVDNLNALEVKGLISQSYMTFSSRYHGAASSLNTGVPCLATSWSHKYEMLFKDFGMEECVIDPSDKGPIFLKIQQFLDESYNQTIRAKLNNAIAQIKNKNSEMWIEVWKRVASMKTKSA